MPAPEYKEVEVLRDGLVELVITARETPRGPAYSVCLFRLTNKGVRTPWLYRTSIEAATRLIKLAKQRLEELSPAEDQVEDRCS